MRSAAEHEKAGILEMVRKSRPVIHCITNYVTAGEMANLLLAVGAHPMMADGLREAKEAAAVSRGMVINLGTLKEQTVPVMIDAGKEAAKLAHPIVLDPVGAGAMCFRLQTAQQILEEVPCTVIRGNASEICALVGGAQRKRDDLIEAIKAYSAAKNAVIVMTGSRDLIVDQEKVCEVKNGHPMMAQITGTGCMLDGILAAFQTLENGMNRFEKVVWAVAAMGICGELAHEQTERTGGGTGSFRICFMDAMSRLTDRQIRRLADIEA